MGRGVRKYSLCENNNKIPLKETGKNISKDRGYELRFHFVAIISLAAKLIVTEQNIMPNGDKLPLDTCELQGTKLESSRKCGMFKLTFRKSNWRHFFNFLTSSF